VVAAVLVIGVLKRQGEAAFGEVERAARDQIDGRAQGAFVRLGVCGLLDLQGVEQLGGEGVELEAAVAPQGSVGAAGAGGGQGLQPVQPDAGEVAAKAADRDRIALAVFAVDRDAGNPLKRLRQVGVGEVSDVFGVDDVDDGVRPTLFAQGAGERGADPGDDDLIDVVAS